MDWTFGTTTIVKVAERRDGDRRNGEINPKRWMFTNLYFITVKPITRDFQPQSSKN